MTTELGGVLYSYTTRKMPNEAFVLRLVTRLCAAGWQNAQRRTAADPGHFGRQQWAPLHNKIATRFRLGPPCLLYGHHAPACVSDFSFLPQSPARAAVLRCAGAVSGVAGAGRGRDGILS